MHARAAAPNTLTSRLNATQTILQLLASALVLDHALGDHRAVEFGAADDEAVSLRRQVLRWNVLDRGAEVASHIPDALHPRFFAQAIVGGDVRGATPGGVFQHVGQHLPVETAVNVQGPLESDRRVAEPRQIRVNVLWHLEHLPSVARHVVRQELRTVTLGSVTVQSVIVGVAAEDQHQPPRDEGRRMQETRRRGVLQQNPYPAIWIIRIQTFAQNLSGFVLRHHSPIHVYLPGEGVPRGRVTVPPLNRIPPSGDYMPLASTEIVLLHRIQVPQVRRVTEQDDHPVGFPVSGIFDDRSRMTGRF